MTEKNHTQETETKATVRFFGDDLGIQFSHKSNGCRTREAKITDIREATQEEIEKYSEQGFKDWEYNKLVKNKTKSRGLFENHHKGRWTILIGKSSYNIRGCNPSKVIVIGRLFKDRPLEDSFWESVESIWGN